MMTEHEAPYTAAPQDNEEEPGPMFIADLIDIMVQDPKILEEFLRGLPPHWRPYRYKERRVLYPASWYRWKLGRTTDHDL